MGLSFTHLIITLIVILIIFGAGKLPKVMGELGKGIKNFRDEFRSDDSEEKAKPQSRRIKNGKK